MVERPCPLLTTKRPGSQVTVDKVLRVNICQSPCLRVLFIATVYRLNNLQAVTIVSKRPESIRKLADFEEGR